MPTPIREDYEFVEWQDENGRAYISEIMPSESILLKAVWKAEPKIIFDENGGTDVSDISALIGESIILPTPKKAGYAFAGWYTANREKYEPTEMPATVLTLKAGWYKLKSVTQVILDETHSVKFIKRQRDF